VDTASGVESSAGKKDRRKMAAFFSAAVRMEQEPPVRIAPAQSSDAEEILALQKTAYRSEAELYQDFSIPPLTQSRSDIESEFDRKRFLKATVDGHVIGSVRGELRNGTCHIERLIVHPGWQNRGIGGKLLRAVEAQFPEADRFELFTGERSQRNLHLYQKMGYRPFRQHPFNERITLVYLEKKNPNG
jgi:ribosomal protein S18 acetylase RimI-like enzyme